MKKTPMTPLEKAVQAVGGKQKTLAQRLGVSEQAVTLIKQRRNGYLPRKRIEDFVRVTGLSREELYPDVFTDV
ncbi:TPA: helix-turn-helix domain-containing protein [Salmonella enterica]|uniref:Helix-turn-helix domain-containing protein n=1 Tax=Salmonella enterica TaxID=28901 RepID=A0A760VVQ2_SALER|nr:transcriptional regulator [Salmonella enterica subsp. enterica serovar Overschie]ECS7344747.1 transcriptional regulator [Salmonella enterica]EDX3937728.1 helix-turn-helix domain-containing protein [Salmonella enterica subsp. enterica serovar Overschie]EEE8139362.1 transcriptional regulator [Salmonella enterica]HAF2581957.1 helix-turn-helix domain-containing protein [Salmonella enterica]